VRAGDLHRRDGNREGDVGAGGQQPDAAAGSRSVNFMRVALDETERPGLADFDRRAALRRVDVEGLVYGKPRREERGDADTGGQERKQPSDAFHQCTRYATNAWALNIRSRPRGMFGDRRTISGV
jgi:hypothetical protein